MKSIFRIVVGVLFCALLVTLSHRSKGAEPCVPKIDPTGFIKEYQAINACTALGGLVRLEDRTYYIEGTIHVKSNTLLEGPSASRKATLLAAPNMGNQIILYGNGTNYVVRNIIVNGNKMKRDYDTPIQGWEDNRWVNHHLCDADAWRPANSKFHGSDIEVYDFESIYSPCGTAVGLSGERIKLWRFRIEHNGFEAPEVRDNRELQRKWPDRSHQYSDGITSEFCDSCVISDGYVGENTDLDIVLGGGPNNHLYNIDCVHRQVYGFSCLNMGRFDTGRTNPATGRKWDADHIGTVVENFRVSSGFEKLSFCISWGGRFFTNDVVDMVIHNAGLLKDSRVEGCQVGVAVDAVEAGEIRDVFIGEVQGARGNFNHCQTALKYVVGNVKPGVILQSGFVRMTMHGGKCVSLE